MGVAFDLHVIDSRSRYCIAFGRDLLIASYDETFKNDENEGESRHGFYRYQNMMR